MRSVVPCVCTTHILYFTWVSVLIFVLFTRCHQVTDDHPDSGDSQQEAQVLGQLMGEFEDLNFFVAACYKGLVDLTYLSLYCKTLQLKHAPLVNSDVHETMETAFSGAELQSTLYPTEQGLKRSNDNPDEPMLSVAAKFLLDPIKNVKVRRK